MAQLLIKIKDHVNPDPDVDRAGAYKAGMVGAVVEDDHIWGSMERKAAWIAAGNPEGGWHNKTAIIKMPGVLVADVIELLNVQRVDDAGLAIPENATMYRRREFTLTTVDWPFDRRSEMAEFGEITSNKNTLRPFVRRIRDNSPAPEVIK